MNRITCLQDFINQDRLTSEKFNVVFKYIKVASITLKRQFYHKINFIVECFLTNTIEGLDGNAIYQSYGITDQQFQNFLSLYLSSHVGQDNVVGYLQLIKKDVSLFNPEVFEIAKKRLWSEECFQFLAEGYHLDYSYFKSMFWLYAKDSYHIAFDDRFIFTKAYTCFKKFLDKEPICHTQKRKVYLYYQKYATEEEKEEFIKVARTYLMQFQDYIAQDDAPSFLERFSLNHYDLYFFLSVVPNILPSTRKIICNQFKYYYDSGSTFGFINKRLEVVAKSKGISTNEFLLLAKAYAREICGNVKIDEDIARLKERQVYTKKIYVLLDQAIEEEDLFQAKEIISSNHVTPEEIRLYCYKINQSIPLDQKPELERKLLNILKEIHQEHSRKNSSTNYDKYYEYLNGDLPFQEFCNEKGLDSQNYRYQYRQIADQKLATRLKERILTDLSHDRETQMGYFKDLLNCIINGIIVHGIHRKFTLFDYFYYFGELNLHKVRVHYLPLTDSEKRTLRIFFRPLASAIALNRENVIHYIYEFNSLKDEKGFPIKGTGKILTEEDMSHIVEIFEEKNIPLFDVVVNMAARLYHQNTLVEIDTLQRK